jgi:hypothetical protein
VPSDTAASTRAIAVTVGFGAAPPMSSRPTTSAATPIAVSAKPRPSNGGGSGARTSGTSLRASSSPATPSGTLMTKIHRQDAYVLRMPLRAGAITGASRAGQVR